jgi:hypothetical protein
MITIKLIHYEKKSDLRNVSHYLLVFFLFNRTDEHYDRQKLLLQRCNN